MARSTPKKTPTAASRASTPPAVQGSAQITVHQRAEPPEP
ncbi:hypothetical protein DB31_7839 [Hyalangium minutum]|uniref:Uncharacterized protein n=1 Tax=Hyalangium minutum TaxID=394096 RepID=A0A085WLN9_9BACT|nr:hypothetical protein DB31_7839 [Hyalangium minutum]